MPQKEAPQSGKLECLTGLCLGLALGEGGGLTLGLPACLAQFGARLVKSSRRRRSLSCRSRSFPWRRPLSSARRALRSARMEAGTDPGSQTLMDADTAITVSR